MCKINVENLKKTVELLKNTLKENFNMRDYKNITDCGTTMCVVGHARQAFDPRFNLIGLDVDPESKNIAGYHCEWQNVFFGVEEMSDEWDYLFGHDWSYSEKTNTPEHAIYRIEKVIEGYEPKNIDTEYKKEIFK